MKALLLDETPSVPHQYMLLLYWYNKHLRPLTPMNTTRHKDGGINRQEWLTTEVEVEEDLVVV
jgi:hypothetical protein